MKFTILIATLGNKIYLEKCFSSLNYQTFKDFEVIVVDQGKDDLADFTKKFNLNLIYKRISVKGLSLARNIGVLGSSGEYVAFLDDDAFYKSDFLEKADIIIKDKKLDGITGIVLDEKSKKPIGRSIKANKSFFITLSDYGQWMSSATIIRKQCIMDVGGYDLNFGTGKRWGSGEESDLLLRLIHKKYRMFFSNKLIAYHPSEKDKIKDMSLKQLFKRGYSYGLGRGALIKKQLSIKIIWSIKSIAVNLLFSIAGFCLSLLKLNFKYAIRDIGGFFGKLFGFILYKKNYSEDFLKQSSKLVNNPKIRVIHVTKHYFPEIGGIETYVKSLAEKLKDKVKISIVTSNTKLRFKNDTIKSINVIRLPKFIKIFSTVIYPSLYFFLRNNNSDVYHLHLPDPFSTFCFLLANPKGKLIITWHSDIVKQKFLLLFYRPFQKKILKRAEKIIVTSPHYLSSPELSNFKDKCEIIPIGIELKQFETNQKINEEIKKIKEKYPGKIILFIGRLVYYKGLKYLIEAMKGIDSTLLIIGEGKLETKLRKQSKKMKNIVFLGKVDNLEPYYHACNFLVLPSIERSEAFGIVQMEAMACGKPVISTKLNTGVEYINQHRKTGLIVSPKDSNALNQAIIFFLNNPQIVKKYGGYAKKRLEKEFSANIIAEKILLIYNRI